MAVCNITSRALAAVVAIAAAFALIAVVPSPAQAGGYYQTNFVSDIPGFALRTDPNLVNPWGIAVNPSNNRFWVVNNGTDTSTIYRKTGVIEPLVVNIPGPDDEDAEPIGIVFNTTDSDFLVTQGLLESKAIFIFCTEAGTILGWDPSVDLTNAIQTVDHSADGASYTGLALGVSLLDGEPEDFLYVANFGQGVVDVFDEDWNYVGSFTDPDVPEGYAPFNVRNINGKLYVVFAKKDDEGDEVPGDGFGYVTVFDTDGNVLKRLIRRGALNAPWGIALAPPKFGEFGNALLVGNFGNGRINAFSPTTGVWLGSLKYAVGGIIHIEGLWGLEFLPPAPGAKFDTLFFTAGIDDETHGLFGSLFPSQLYGGTAPILHAP